MKSSIYFPYITTEQFTFFFSYYSYSVINTDENLCQPNDDLKKKVFKNISKLPLLHHQTHYHLYSGQILHVGVFLQFAT